MNRKQRRHPEKQWDAEFVQTQELGNEIFRDCMPEEYFREKVAAMEKMQKNGITVEDLKKNYDIGFDEGYKFAGKEIVMGCFAAICLALNETHGFGRKRCCDVLNVVDRHMMYTLTSGEAVQEVWDKIGLQLLFDEAFDRVQEKDERKKDDGTQ
jgi:hypothetical protein